MNELQFIVFIINKYATAKAMTVTEVFRLFTALHILDNYIIPHYEVLHTLGEKYLIEDITEIVLAKQSQI
jgi:ATP-dependent RNA circularization protein (DNA/RNA ligase family)